MATLGAMFRLYDNYSRAIDRITNTTVRATDRILGASVATDRLNQELNETQRNANGASNGLEKMIKTFIGFAGIKKGMDIVDNYANTSARLGLINDGLQTQLELQDKIFAAADRSRGSYNEMASAIAKMGLLAGDAFSGNDELIAFTELVQKSFKVGGADTSEQMGAMRQLSQAMASGRLQGDELVSIMENAPMIYEAIAKFTGLSKGELKELSSSGAITADIIKDAMFSAADDINKAFSTLPMTFGDHWNKIKNGALRAFRPIIEGTSELINSDGFIKSVDSVIAAFYIMSSVIGAVFGFIRDNFGAIMPWLLILTGTILTNLIAKLWATIPPLIAKVGAWLLLNLHIIAVFAAIGLVIGVLMALGVTFEDLFGYIGGGIGYILGLFENLGILVQNAFIAIMQVIEPIVLSIVNLIIDGINKIIGMINKIKGIDVDTIDRLSGHFEGKEYQQFINLTDRYNQGVNKGKEIYGAFSSKLDSLTSLGNFDLDLSKFGTSQNPLNVTSKDKLKVDISKENLQYLRDIAERDYVNKFSTATLAPQIQVTFGDVHEEADANKVAGRIKKILQEEIAMVSEGSYA